MLGCRAREGAHVENRSVLAIAKEAVLAALYAKTDQDMQDLHELARTWTQAALQERRPSQCCVPPLNAASHYVRQASFFKAVVSHSDASSLKPDHAPQLPH